MNVEPPHSTPMLANIDSPCSFYSTVSLSVPSDLLFSVGSSPDGKMMFTCYCCSNIYMGKREMWEHVQVAHKKVPLCCFFRECACKFGTGRGLKYHIESVQKVKMLRKKPKKRIIFSHVMCVKRISNLRHSMTSFNLHIQ